MERLEACWAEQSIPFVLTRSTRRTLSITVQPSGDVAVKAPISTPAEEVVARVSRRGAWIRLQQERAGRWRPRTPPRTYVEGETHLYLGRQYRLSAELAVRQEVRIAGDRIVLRMHRPGRLEERAELLSAWYLARAREVYARRLKALVPPFLAMGHPCPRIIVRHLSHRWGSLTAAGNMVLSRDLIRAPRACVDYVIVHELCHLAHRDHGPGFWSLLDASMPDHDRRKGRLEKMLL